jgi:hypothetical protein
MPKKVMFEKIDRFARFQNECADFFIDVATKHQPQDEKFIASAEINLISLQTAAAQSLNS